MININDTEKETIMVVSEQGFGKRSDIEDYRVTRRGAKGVKTLNVTDKTGKLVAIKCVTDDDDIMIINKSGITLRLHLKDVRIIGRATQGVRLINLTKRNDQISSVCKVLASDEEDETVDPVVEEYADGQLVSYSNEDAPKNEASGEEGTSSEEGASTENENNNNENN
jgi:DNA gyrase subunit A